MKLWITATAILLAALASAGCDQGRSAPPDVRVAVVNAVPSYGGIEFLREERSPRNGETIQYQGTASFSFDADQYDFNLQVFPVGTSGVERIHTFSETLIADHDHWFVLAEDGDQIEVVTVATPVLDGDAADAAALVVHAHEDLDPVDAYLEPPGADLAGAAPLGSVAFLEDLAPQSREPGDYRLTLTSPGDASAVLFESPTMTFAAGEPNLLTITSGAGQGLADVQVVRMGGASAVLTDPEEPAGVRVINAAADGTARDVYVDGDFTTPLAASVAVGEATDHTLIAPGTRDFTVTPAGNPGVFEIEETHGPAPGGLYTYFLTGDGNGLQSILGLENRHVLDGAAQLQLINGATQLGTLGFFLAPPGTDVTTISPMAQMAAPAMDLDSLVVPGDYEMTLVDAETLATVAGPTAITLSEGGVYGLLAINGADGATAEMVLLDDFTNP